MKSCVKQIAWVVMWMVWPMCAAHAVLPRQEAPKLLDGYYTPYPAITPAPGHDLDQVKRGEYLAQAGDCVACHTNSVKHTPAFAGGLKFVTPFGTFYSPNITPDKATGIGTWTEHDFVRAIKHGLDPQGRNYLPIFPFAYFAHVTDEDARALYAYFMSIPPVVKQNKPLPFPFNLPGARLTLWGWKLLFFYPNTLFVEDKTKSPAWNRGKYLVDGLGHCAMCHSPMNPLGSPSERYYLAGGFINGYWAPNITGRALANIPDQDIVDVFAKGELLNHAGPVAGPMAEVNHDSLIHLTTEDHLAIATYLKTVESDEWVGLPGSAAEPTLQRGKKVYMSSCILCHQNGEMGAPRIGQGANFSLRLRTSGLQGLYRHAIDGFNSMPLKGACVTCSDNDIMSAVDYILDKSLTRSQRIDLDVNHKNTRDMNVR